MKKHLSHPRLDAVDKFFVCNNSERQIIGCYHWGQAVSAAFLPLMATFEVSLRNSLHRSLSQHYGAGVQSFDWLTPPGPGVQSLHKLNSKAKDDVEKIVTKYVATHHKSPTPDDIVSRLNFGFWEVLISSLNHAAQPVGTQSSILSSCMPNAPVSAAAGFSSNQFRIRIVKLLTRIRDIRNGIGHHEPIWKTAEFNDDGVVGFYPRKPMQGIVSIRMAADRITTFSSWIDPSLPTQIHASDHWGVLQSLLTSNALSIYRHRGGGIGCLKLSQSKLAPIYEYIYRKLP